MELKEKVVITYVIMNYMFFKKLARLLHLPL